MHHKIKYLSSLLIYIFISCNNDDNVSKSTSETLSQEQQLKNNIARYPDSALLTESLVQYYRESGNYPQALAIINTSIKKESNNPRLWDIKATLEIENADTSASIHSFEKAIEIYPDPQYIISLGALYAQTKNPNALQMADALLIGNKAQADKEAYFIKGLYYTYAKNKEKAITFFDKCISLNYTYMDAYLEKALALYDLNKFTAALAVLDKALTLQNSFDAGYYYRGKCLEKLNRPQEAAEAYKSALMYDPEYTDAKNALANLQAKKP
ncbi:MAG: tetratricopeptide repeat protein [Ferruginibacter sp.]